MSLHRGKKNVTIWLLPAHQAILNRVALANGESKVKYISRLILNELSDEDQYLWRKADFEHRTRSLEGKNVRRT